MYVCVCRYIAKECMFHGISVSVSYMSFSSSVVLFYNFFFLFLLPCFVACFAKANNNKKMAQLTEISVCEHKSFSIGIYFSNKSELFLRAEKELFEECLNI